MCVSYVSVLYFILPRELLSQNVGVREFLVQIEYSWDSIDMMNQKLNISLVYMYDTYLVLRKVRMTIVWTIYYSFVCWSIPQFRKDCLKSPSHVSFNINS